MRFAILIVGFLVAAATSAQAQWGGNQGYGYGVPGIPLIAPAFTPAPPYFALHPPVYYGQRYTRPYGVSPFASRPMLQAAPGYAPRRAAVITQQPLVVMNPHFQAVRTIEGREVVQATHNSSAPNAKMQWVENPFAQPKQVFTAK